MNKPIITSLLDTDLYKFTMMQCILHHFPDVQATYHFKCRKPVDLRADIAAIQQQIIHLSQLKINEEELNYLKTLPFLKTDFVDYLKNFQFNPNHVQVQAKENLTIQIQGPWLETILFEVPLLAIISETHYKEHYPDHTLNQARARLAEKIQFLKDPSLREIQFTDFGTRRRFSKAWQEEIIATLKAQVSSQFVGTSNVYFAKKHNLPPIGTMAHEYLQAFQVLAPDIKQSQHYALHLWLEEYPDSLGIALTDVLSMDCFLREFDLTLAERYSGLRQDSGDPIVWGDKAIVHYQKLGIDPRTRTFIFSDNLTFPKMAKIYHYFKNRCQPSFGIGTNLTNDTGPDPLDIVIKLTHINQHPVVKISDSPGKIICEDDNYLQFLKKTFHL